MGALGVRHRRLAARAPATRRLHPPGGVCPRRRPTPRPIPPASTTVLLLNTTVVLPAT